MHTRYNIAAFVSVFALVGTILAPSSASAQFHVPASRQAEWAKIVPRAVAPRHRLRRFSSPPLATSARFSPSVNGEIPLTATFGAGDPASPGVDSSNMSVADGVNPETGGLSESTTDFSIPTFGPSLDFTRTYDSLLAQQQTASGKPGSLGYGWSSSFGTSLTIGTPEPGFLYRAAGPSGTGSGYAGDGGLATNALLYDPYGVTVDSHGDVFVADSGNNRIQMIAAGNTTPLVASTTPGDIYTVAGSTTNVAGTCTNGSVAVGSCLKHPTGVAVDPAGNLYIADAWNNRIEMVAATTSSPFVSGGTTVNRVYTVAGQVSGTSGVPTNGSGATSSSAKLNDPEGVTLDSAGNLYIADRTNMAVEEVPANAVTQWGSSFSADDIYVIAGQAGSAGGHSGDTGAAASALLNLPSGVSLDSSGNLFIADDGNARVQEVAATTTSPFVSGGTSVGHIYTIAGNANGTHGNSGDGGPATSALISANFGVTVDSSGNVYLTDSGNNEIQEVARGGGDQWGQSMSSGDIYTVAGSASGTSGNSGGHPATSGLLGDPSGVGIDPWGDLFIAQSINNKVSEVAGTARSPLPVQPTPVGVTINQPSGSQTNFYPIPSAYSINGATYSSGSVTVTTGSTLNLVKGGTLTVSGVTPSGYNGTYTTTSVSQTSFTYSLGSSPGTYSSGGSATGCDAANVGPNTTVGTYCTLPENNARLTYNSGTSQYTYTDNSNISDVFDSTGKLLSESSLSGDVLTLSYNSPAKGSGYCPNDSNTNSCNTITSASGRAFVEGLNSSGLITSVTDPMGRSYTYLYNSSNQLTLSTDPMSHVTSYTYGLGSTGNSLLTTDLLTVTNPNGQTGGPDAGAYESTTYDALGRVISQRDPQAVYTGGNATTISYTGLNQSTGTGTSTTVDPDQNETDFGFQQAALVSHTVWDTSAVTGGSYSGSTATINFGVQDASGTSLAAGTVPPVGSTIKVSGVTPSAYDCSCVVTASSPGSVSYTQTGLSPYSSGGAASVPAASNDGPDLTRGSLLEVWTADEDGNQTNYAYDANGNLTSSQDPVGNTDTYSSDSTTNAQLCTATAMASTTCATASPPNPVAPGGTITPLSSAPPQGDAYSLIDSDGNTLYTSEGVYEPGSSSAFESTAAYTRTSYTFFKGNSVTIRAWQPGQSAFATQSVACTSTPPSQSLPCASIDEDGVVTQIAYDSHGDVTSTATPDGNGTEVSKTTSSAYPMGYDADGEQLTSVSADGNVSGANAGNYTTQTVYNSDAEPTSVSKGNGSGYTDSPRTTIIGYDNDGNQTSVENARGNISTTSFDADDAASIITNPLGDMNLICRDAEGNSVEIVTPDTVTAATVSSGTATVTASNSFLAGQKVIVAGVNSSGQPSYSFNGTFTVASSPCPHIYSVLI